MKKTPQQIRLIRMSLEELRDEAALLIGQRTGTTKDPSYAAQVLAAWFESKGGKESKADYYELILTLEAGEPPIRNEGRERLNEKFTKILEKTMAKNEGKKTSAKKTGGSPFGGSPKPAVDRPKADTTKEKREFKPTSEKELADITKTAKAKDEAKRGGTAKKAAEKTNKQTGAAAKKADKKPAAEKKQRSGGIGALARELIGKGMDSDKVIAEVKKKFPDSAINERHVAWYRNAMKREAA